MPRYEIGPWVAQAVADAQRRGASDYECALVFAGYTAPGCKVPKMTPAERAALVRRYREWRDGEPLGKVDIQYLFGQ